VSEIVINQQQLMVIRRELPRLPLPILAQKYGCSVIELCAAIRAAGEPLEAQPVEIQHIFENQKRVPPAVLRRQMRMTATQFSQLCSRIGVVTQKPAHEVTLDEAREQTRWLVETLLSWKIDDFLPRRISNENFLANNLYGLVAFATKEKEKGERFRGFPAVAFLVATAYPGLFQPFQFRHAKLNSYFKNRHGKRRYLHAVQWVLEEKLGLKREYIRSASQSKSFLRAIDLQFYGLGPHLYRLFFPSKTVLVDELLSCWGQERDKAIASTARLRKVIEASGRSASACEVPGCTAMLSAVTEIHHIVPRAARGRFKFDLDSQENLMVLCRNHHGAAHDFPWEAFIGGGFDARRIEIQNFLSSAGSI
jgi:hypothetical protein